MASQMQEPISDTASYVVQQAGEKVDQAVTVAKQQTTSRLDGERERVADGLYSTAHALRQVGQQLREQEQGTIASMADRAAQQAERASGYLRSRDLPELLNETEQLGRAHPLPFMGGAIALGLLGVRFLKSSRAQVESAPTQAAATPTQVATTPPAVPDKVDVQLPGRGGSVPPPPVGDASKGDTIPDADEAVAGYGADDDGQGTLAASTPRPARERR